MAAGPTGLHFDVKSGLNWNLSKELTLTEDGLSDFAATSGHRYGVGLAWRGDERTDRAAVVAGGCLIGWIVVQLLFIRELSFFHPTYLAVGALFVWSGRRALGRQPSRL